MNYRYALRGGAFAFLSMVLPHVAFASDGDQFTAYGVKAQGMGGASVAFPQDAISAANNPAGMAFVGNRIDGGVQTIYINAHTEIGDSRHHGTSIVPVPEAGYNRDINSKITLGVSTSPSGALFRYTSNLATGVDHGKTKGMLINTLVLPTATYRPLPNLAIGVSAALGMEVLQLHDLPGSENHGLRPSFGAGWRIGGLWKATNWLAIGASYASKVNMSRTHGYDRDILSSVGGHVDVPEKISAGVAITPVSHFTIAADYVHINWDATQFHTLFGFRNQNVARVGVSYAVTPEWTVRSGVSLARRAPSREFVLNNALITSIASKAATAGLTHTLKNGSEISAAAEVDFGSPLRGTGPSAGTTIHSTYIELGLGYGIHF